jgi:hypothetical protein
MEYITKNIIDPILDFVKTCPFLEQYNIDLKQTSVQRLITSKPDGSALDYVGSNMVSDNADLLRKRYTQRQANFQLWLMRKSNHNVYREEVADFLFNFEQWVEHCQAYGLTPKLSDTPEGQYEELMTADNGVYFAEWDGNESSLYMIQLHIQYFNTYK